MTAKSTQQPAQPDPAETLAAGSGAASPAPTLSFLPTFRSELTTPSEPGGRHHFAVGQQVDDFQFIQVLGEGAFGQVFLARQISLGRLVAVKVTANRGNEARTLASLEHDHIVQVFSEIVDPRRDVRLLCMQYVPGTTLSRIIAELSRRPPERWSGRAILEIIDRLNTQPTPFHPAALRDRDLLAEADHIEAVCWFGARLAEALDYAHARGILHRDIKPANILVNSYGRPLLADFNLAIQTEREGDSIYGGTLAYMAPEHLDAFNPQSPTTWDAVDARSDIYSLGVVLFELLTGRRPFAVSDPTGKPGEALQKLAEERRVESPSPRQWRYGLPECLDQTLRKCLDPDPALRYQSGAELARALEGATDIHRIQRELPPAGPLTRAVQRRPFIGFIILLLLPHVLGSIVNIWYNELEIASGLDAAQKAAFGALILGYNVIVYPLCIFLMCRLVIPVARTWRRFAAGEAVPAEAIDSARQRVLTWPLWAVGLACLGWLPGGVIFPLGIHLAAGPLPAEVFGHFLVSFTISGLIALTYSYFAVQYIVLRVLYPRLWLDPANVSQTIAAEVAPVGRRLRVFQVLAGAIPLLAAMLMTGVGEEISSYRSFRILVTTLIVMGMVGFGISVLVQTILAKTIAALANAPRRPSTAASRVSG